VTKIPNLGINLKDLQIPVATLQQYAALLTPEPLTVNATELLNIIKLPEAPKITIPKINFSELIQPALPKFPSGKDVVDAVNSMADALGPVADALKSQVDEIRGAAAKGANVAVNTATAAAAGAAKGAANAAADLLKKIPSLSLPFQPQSIDLTNLGVDLSKLPKLDLSGLASINLPKDLSPEQLTAKITGDLKKIFAAKA